jgi:Ca2+-binding RTX toxin-like protein
MVCVMSPRIVIRSSIALAVLLLLTLMPAGSASAGRVHYCFGERATIVATDRDDVIKGTGGPDVIVALGGKDVVDAKGGDDLVCLGPGGSANNVEWAWGRGGDDRIRGGSGFDLLIGGPGDDVLIGGPGEDQLRGGREDNLLIGGPGGDGLTGGSGEDELRGGRGRDQLYGGTGGDRLFGGAGRDELLGGNRDDLLRGGAGSDWLEGHGGDDRIVGGSGGKRGDVVSYTTKNGGCCSSNRPVTVNLGRGVATGFGRDTIRGVENVFGSGGDDVLIGDHRANVLIGSSGDDRLHGRGGGDCLKPSPGIDEVDGGRGFDFFTANFRDCGPDGFVGGPNISPGVTVNLAEGYASYDLQEQENRSTLISIDGAYGSDEEDTLIGDDWVNKLFGRGAADHIEGRGGEDYLDGNKGADIIDGEDGIDTCFGEVVINCEEGELSAGTCGRVLLDSACNPSDDSYHYSLVHDPLSGSRPTATVSFGFRIGMHGKWRLRDFGPRLPGDARHDPRIRTGTIQ